MSRSDRPKNNKKTQTLYECKDLHKRLGISRELAERVSETFPELRLTPRTERALAFAVTLGRELGAVDDEALLSQLLDRIGGGRYGLPEASALIGKYGDILSVVTAGVETGLTSGECMRLALSVVLCLSSGALGVIIKNRRNAAFYFEHVLLRDDDREPIAACLGANFETLAVVPCAPELVKSAAACGAKYVLIARRDDGLVRDVKTDAEKLKAELADENIKLVDYLVFDDDGYAAFSVGSALPDNEINFEYF